MEKNGGGGSGGGSSAPTGCYKCGRPGHWSRDCPSNPNSNPNPNPNPSPNNNDDPHFPNSTNTTSHHFRPPIPTQKQQKQKAPRRSRPKLTPSLLLDSDQGIGHILRYFPRALKCRGRGHEVSDLRHLLSLYAEWNSRMIPYYGFDQFINKVEKVGATKRVKTCLRELRDRVGDGADPSKLHEMHQNSGYEQDAQGDLDMPSHLQENPLQNENTSNFPEDMPQAVWENATEAPLDNGSKEVRDERVDSNNAAGSSNQNQMSEEQKARMEANRLKALERAAARSRSTQT